MIYAQQVTRDEALRAAINALKYHSPSRDIPVSDSVYAYCRNGRTLIYEIHFDSGEIVLLSGNKNCQPILGCVYSDDESALINNHQFEPILSLGDNCPDGLKVFIKEYIEQIEYCFTHSMAYSFAAEWEDSQRYDESKVRNIILISPLTTTKWGQGKSNDNYGYAYNYYSPNGDNCIKCYAGCGPVALAQILRYWESPTSVPASCRSYYWDDMPNELLYNDNPSYNIQRNAIARLIKDCGDAVNASYCESNCETSSYITDIFGALKEFQFNEAYMYTEIQAGNHSIWVNMLIQELLNDRPVLYAAYDYSVTPHKGHGFVCDGYYRDANDHDYFYFNWGWNGDYNAGYFTLPYLNPGLHNYPNAHKAIFNIHPSTCWEDIIFGCDKYFVRKNASFSAEETIQNDGHVFSVLQESVVTLKAAEEIILTDGFSVSNGGKFVAKIEDCEPDELGTEDNVAPITETRANRTTAVDVAFTPSLQIFPNPANSTVTLQLADAQDEIRQITVANMQGQVMLSQTVNATTPYTLNISALPAGIYAVCVLTANGQTLTGKMVKFG